MSQDQWPTIALVMTLRRKELKLKNASRQATSWHIQFYFQHYRVQQNKEQVLKVNKKITKRTWATLENPNLTKHCKGICEITYIGDYMVQFMSLIKTAKKNMKDKSKKKLIMMTHQFLDCFCFRQFHIS